MDCVDEGMPDTQPCENWTQSQSQDVNSQSLNIWGQLVPSQKSSKWGITFPLIQLSKDCYKAGRSNECDIEFNSTSISDKHLRVISKVHFLIVREEINKKHDVVVFLYDNSQNGTFINKKLVGKGNRQILDHDDVIALSKPSLTVWKFLSVNVYAKSGLPPELSENYALLRNLGNGACGEVKLVYSKTQYRAYAIKTIITHDATIVDANKPPLHNSSSMIMNEVVILKALNNPFIIKMAEIVTTPSQLYIILEFMEGGDLHHRICSQRLTEKQNKFIFYQLVQAVSYLHSKKITHRDLKPENILLASDAEFPLVKISDFGLSKLVDARTMMKTFCGTPVYVAPEILKTSGRGAYTNLVDVWSLGVILYTCLSGCVPFWESSNRISLQEQIMKGEYTFQKRQFANVSKSAIDLVKQMMTVDPSKRKSIRQIILHEWLSERRIRGAVDRLLTCNENILPNNVQNVENFQPPERVVADQEIKNVHVFGIPGPILKKARRE